MFKRHIGAVGLTDFPNLEHVRIIPMAGSRIFLPLVLGKTNPGNTPPIVLDITGRPPEVGVNAKSFHVFKRSGIGKTQDNVAPGSSQILVDTFRCRHVVGIPVYFYVIESPSGPLFGIFVEHPYRSHTIHLLLVQTGITTKDLSFLQPVFLRKGKSRKVRLGVGSAPSGKSGISTHPRGRIDADFQTQTMQSVAHGLHVTEFFIGLDRKQIPPSPTLPAVVDIHITPTVFNKPLIMEQPGYFFNGILANRFTV